MGFWRRIVDRVVSAFTGDYHPREPDVPFEAVSPGDGMPAYDYAVAGYTDAGGFTHDVEGGDSPPSDYDLEMGGRFVVRITDADGVDRYYTILGGVDDDYTIEDAIADIYERYGGEFA